MFDDELRCYGKKGLISFISKTHKTVAVLSDQPICVKWRDGDPFWIKQAGRFGWLLGWSGLFLITGLVVIVFPGHFYMPDRTTNGTGSNPFDRVVTARLWILCPLAILIVMHGLVVFTVAKGLAFL